MPDLLKAAERLAKTVRTVFLAAVENAGFLLDGLCRAPECLGYGKPGCAEDCFLTAPAPGGFVCLAPPFECLGCVTTADCTWPHNPAVPAAEPSPIPPGDEGPVSVSPTAHGAPNVYVVTQEVMEAIHLLHDAGISPEIYQLLNPEK